MLIQEPRFWIFANTIKILFSHKNKIKQNKYFPLQLNIHIKINNFQNKREQGKLTAQVFRPGTPQTPDMAFSLVKVLEDIHQNKIKQQNQVKSTINITTPRFWKHLGEGESSRTLFGERSVWAVPCRQHTELF